MQGGNEGALMAPLLHAISSQIGRYDIFTYLEELFLGDTYMNLEQEIIFRWLVLLALQTVLSGVFANLYTTVDGIFVARWVDTNALSAINITLPMVYLARRLA